MKKLEKSNRKILAEQRNCASKLRFKDKNYSIIEIGSSSSMISSCFEFGSKRSYLKAVTKIYLQESKDIDRFIEYAETLIHERDNNIAQHSIGKRRG